jgi:WD40 repeat protein
MTERLHPNARLHLADRLSEQVEKASGEDLLAEAAQDFGDRRALAKEFDRALARAVAQERNRRFGDRLAELALHLLTPSWSHLMGAVALAVVVIAGALYLMERSRLGPDHPEVAIARQSLEKLLAERAQERESTAERQAAERQVSTPVNVQMLAVLADHAGPVESCAFSPDGRRIVTAARHTLRVWDVHSGFVIHEFKGANQRLAWVGFGPDNQVVATYADRSILTWGAAGEITAASLAPRRSVGRSLVLGPNDREVVARDDNTVRLFERGREIAALHGHQGPVTTAVANADGTRILTASDDRTTRIWDTRTGQQLSILRGGDTSVASAAFSPDASRVVTTDRRDANVYVWDAASGAQTAVLRGHSAPVVHAAFSPDGRRLITASDDGTARLWDAERAGAIAVLEGHAGPVTSAAFSPDGRLVATTSQDGTARLWRVPPNGR